MTEKVSMGVVPPPPSLPPPPLAPSSSFTSGAKTPLSSPGSEYEQLGPSSQIVSEPPPPPDLDSYPSSKVGKTVRADGKKAAKQYKICVYVLRAAIVLWVFMAIWTFLLYAHSKEMMNLIPTLNSFAPILVPSELNSLTGEEE